MKNTGAQMKNKILTVITGHAKEEHVICTTLGKDNNIMVEDPFISRKSITTVSSHKLSIQANMQETNGSYTTQRILLKMVILHSHLLSGFT